MVHHAVCWGCHPNLDGPARCGTLPDVVNILANVTCNVCADLDPVPCEKCQPNLFALWLAMDLDGGAA
jgi:hypothetical protein